MGLEKRKNKTGKLSDADIEYIETYRHKKSIEEIGAHIRRAPDQIGKYILAHPDGPEVKPNSFAGNLEDRPEWSQLELQYTEEELNFFKYRFYQLLNQFGKDDVLPTEEMQITTLIHMEIMGQQTLSERKTLVTQQKLTQERLEGLYDVSRDHDPDSPSGIDLFKEISVLELRFADLSKQLKMIGDRHHSFTMQQSKLLEQLKATRDQRVKVVEGSKKSFLGYLKALTEEDFRTSEGRDAALMLRAKEKAYFKMAEPRTYIDGTVDQPLLTPETVAMFGDDYEPAGSAEEGPGSRS